MNNLAKLIIFKKLKNKDTKKIFNMLYRKHRTNHIHCVDCLLSYIYGNSNMNAINLTLSLEA